MCPALGNPSSGSRCQAPFGTADQPSHEEGQHTVLVVEDDESRRFALATLLTREGYLVLTAATAHDALGVLRDPLSPL